MRYFKDFLKEENGTITKNLYEVDEYNVMIYRFTNQTKNKEFNAELTEWYRQQRGILDEIFESEIDEKEYIRLMAEILDE